MAELITNMTYEMAIMMMGMAIESELDSCDDAEDRNDLIKILSSPGSWDYYSQINGEYAIKSYEFLYQFYADDGEESPNSCIAELIYDYIWQ